MDPEPSLFVFLISFESVYPFIGLAALILLLTSSALVSGSEVAFFSLTPSQINNLKEKNDKKSNLIVKLVEAPEKLLATILIANNFINIAIVILSSYLINEFIDFAEASDLFVFLIKVVVITFILLLFGEIIPKVYATHAGLKFAKLTAFPLSLSKRLFSPVSFLLIKSTSIVHKKINKQTVNISVDDLSKALELTKSDIKEDKKILEGIVNFGTIDVKEIMKPRVDVIAIEQNESFGKLMSLIIEKGFSRIPVYSESLDEIKGVLYIKDILPYIDKGKDYEWGKLIREPYFVPDTMKIDDLLSEFQHNKIHMAMVINEYGGFLGIVTLEDIIEEIVGEIRDETDQDNEMHKKRSDNEYIFMGKIQLNDFYKITKIEEETFQPVKGDYDTLAGWIIEYTGKIPQKGEKIIFKNFSFLISKGDNRKIEEVIFTIGKIKHEKNN